MSWAWLKICAPVGAVEIAVAERFLQMIVAHFRAAVEIGYRACHFQYPVICACRHVEASHGFTQFFQSFCVGAGVFAYLP